MIADLMRLANSKDAAIALPAMDELRRRGYQCMQAMAFRALDSRGALHPNLRRTWSYWAKRRPT